MNYSQEYAVRLNRQFYPQAVQFHGATNLVYLNKQKTLLCPVSRIIVSSALETTCLVTNSWLDTKMGGEGRGLDQGDTERGVDAIKTHCLQFSKN